MKVFFTSDHHISHVNVIKYCNRPFESVDQMNEELVRRHNELVSPDDHVYFLGDFSLSWGAARKYLPRFNGIKILIPGNHDHCSPAHKKGRKHLAEWMSKYVDLGFKEVILDTSIFLYGRKFNLSHFPYTGDHTAQDRFKEYRPKDDGRFLLHGHIHQHWKVRPAQRMINVGVDVWDFFPVEAKQIVELVREAEGLK